MTTALRRLAIIGTAWAVLIGTACFDVSSMLSPAEALQSQNGRQLRGELSASFQAGGLGYESSKIPFVARLKDNRADVSAEAVQRMLATIKRAPARNSSLSAPQSPALSYTSDAAWQAFYDTGAAYISTEAPPEELYVTTSEMDVLTGTTVYAEDLLGDGSATAQLVVERSAGSPYVTATVTLNGQVVHTSNIEYQSSDGGYSKLQHSIASYDQYGSTTMSGTSSSLHLVEVMTRPDVARVHYAAAAIMDVWAALPQLLAPLGPTTAYAAKNCSYWTRRTLLFGAGIVAGAATGVWLGALVSMYNFENSLYGYIRCVQAQ